MGGALEAAALSALFAALPTLASASPLRAALLTVCCATAAAIATSGEVAPRALFAGAAGALLFHATLAAGASAPLAGATLLCAVEAPRLARCRTREIAALAAIVAGVGGATAASLVFSHDGADAVTRAASWAVAGALASLVLAVPIDDATAHALLRAARRVGGTTRRRLLRAVVLRRRMAPHAQALARTTRQRLELAWAALARTAEERASLWPRPAAILDRRIARYVESLARAHRAARARDAWAEDLDDAVLAGLRFEGERLEVEAAALSELDGP